jgi:hypothetical protein
VEVIRMRGYEGLIISFDLNLQRVMETLPLAELKSGHSFKVPLVASPA